MCGSDSYRKILSLIVMVAMVSFLLGCMSEEVDSTSCSIETIEEDLEEKKTESEDTAETADEDACVSDLELFPMTYEDATGHITITREWYHDAWCYIAHLQFSDYTRFGTSCANGSYQNGLETTEHAANRLGAVFAVNGCYSSPDLNYTVVRSGVICNGAGRAMELPGVYSSHTGLFQSAWSSGGASGILGANVSGLVEQGLVTDTFCFGPPILSGGTAKQSSDTSRAQRTFIGTNGNPGDLWIVVSEGRMADGESAGLTYAQCAQLLKEKGCTFGIPLDGGGSSTMVFQGKVLNSAKRGQRPVVDFIYFL